MGPASSAAASATPARGDDPPRQTRTIIQVLAITLGNSIDAMSSQSWGNRYVGSLGYDCIFAGLMGLAGLDEVHEILVTPHQRWLRIVSAVPRRATTERVDRARAGRHRRHLVFGLRPQVPGLRAPTSGTWFSGSDLRYLVFGLRSQALAFGARTAGTGSSGLTSGTGLGV